eukprot:1178908-Prorocentrum_minimum.AAC.6
MGIYGEYCSVLLKRWHKGIISRYASLRLVGKEIALSKLLTVRSRRRKPLIVARPSLDPQVDAWLQ